MTAMKVYRMLQQLASGKPPIELAHFAHNKSEYDCTLQLEVPASSLERLKS